MQLHEVSSTSYFFPRFRRTHILKTKLRLKRCKNQPHVLKMTFRYNGSNIYLYPKSSTTLINNNHRYVEFLKSLAWFYKNIKNGLKHVDRK